MFGLTLDALCGVVCLGAVLCCAALRWTLLMLCNSVLYAVDAVLYAVDAVQFYAGFC